MKRVNLSPCYFIVVFFFLLLLLGCNKGSDTITVVTKQITEITPTTAKCGGKVTMTGNYTIGICGICWSESSNPTIEDFLTKDNNGQFEYVSLMENLKPMTRYFVRAYATTSSGVIYGQEISFTTENLTDDAIIISTKEVVDINATTATCGGVITALNSDVVITRGVCWSTTQNPSTTNHHTIDGQGTGSFTSYLYGLEASTTYYVKAYAQTEEKIVYGEEKHFTTAQGQPSEIEILEITHNTIKIKVTPAPNVDYYYSQIINHGNPIRHEISETILTFNDLLPQTAYSFNFTFYDDNDNLLDTKQSTATTEEQPYEYASVTVTAINVQPGILELQFTPSSNTAYYYFNKGSELTSTSLCQGPITRKYNYLQPNTDYVFSVVAYDANGVQGEVIHPTFKTAPAPYSNYLRQGDTFYPAYYAQITTDVLANNWGQKVIIIKGDTYEWVRLQYLCYTYELDNIWNSGSYTLGQGTGMYGYHGYSCAYNLKWQDSFSDGSFTITKNGNNYTIDLESESELIWAHFSGTVSYN